MVDKSLENEVKGYHINPKTNRANICRAKFKCDFMPDGQHGDTPQEAFDIIAAHEALKEGSLSGTKKVDAGELMGASNAEYTLLEHEDVKKDLSELRKMYPSVFTKGFNQKFVQKFSDYYSFKVSGKELPSGDVRCMIPDAPRAIRERGVFLSSREELAEDEDFPEYNLDACSDYVLVLVTRQGGGNRECWCGDGFPEGDCLVLNNETLQSEPGYIYDTDDSFDSTYATFYFNTKLTDEDLEKFNEGVKYGNAIKAQEGAIESMKLGKLPPWSINEDDHEVIDEYMNEWGNYGKRDLLIKKEKRSKVAIKSCNEAIKKAKLGTLTEDDLRELKSISWSEFREKSASILVRDYDRKKFISEVKNLARLRGEVESLERAKLEAEALPDGELKGIVLNPRGALIKDLNYHKNAIKNRSKLFNLNLHELGEVKLKMGEVLKEYTQERADLEVAREAAWAHGWQGKREDLPKIPDSF